MTVEVFRRAVHHQVDAKRDWLLIDRAGERVVNGRNDTPRPARARDGGNVDAAQRGIDRRFEPDELCALRENRVGLRQLLE